MKKSNKLETIVAVVGGALILLMLLSSIVVVSAATPGQTLYIDDWSPDLPEGARVLDSVTGSISVHIGTGFLLEDGGVYLEREYIDCWDSNLPEGARVLDSTTGLYSVHVGEGFLLEEGGVYLPKPWSGKTYFRRVDLGLLSLFFVKK